MQKCIYIPEETKNWGFSGLIIFENDELHISRGKSNSYPHHDKDLIWITFNDLDIRIITSLLPIGLRKDELPSFAWSLLCNNITRDILKEIVQHTAQKAAESAMLTLQAKIKATLGIY